MSGLFYKAKESFEKACKLLLPPGRVSIWDHSKNVIIDTPGGFTGPFDTELVPYFKKVCEAITSRKYSMVVFAGPAQTGKTQTLLINLVLWMIEQDAHDILILQTSMERARDFSRRELDRALRANPGAREAMDWPKNNTYSKLLKNGVIISVQWPSSKVLAGRALRTIVITDHDRKINLDEGGVVDLAVKRTTTFKSRGRVVVESSPSFNLDEGEWEYSEGSHESPPVEGTLGLFNQGTQNRLYLLCPECKEYFLPEPGYGSVIIPEEGTSMKDRAHRTKMVCSKNGCLIDAKHQRPMRVSAKWLAQGELIDCNGNISGEENGTDIASFWMTGVSAGFQSIHKLSMNYMAAQTHYDRTGSEEKLASVTNVDMGVPYFYKAHVDAIDPSSYEARAQNETFERGEVPAKAYFIVATVDTQALRWPVQITAYGKDHERWIIDRFNIKYSQRTSAEGITEKVEPAKYLEDWDELLKVINKQYIQKLTGNIYLPAVVLIDSGGRPGVTENSYRWWRKINRKPEGKRVVLVKGASRDMISNIKLTRPDSSKDKSRKTISAGDVPLLMLSTNKLKDGIYADLQREEVGPGFIHLPPFIGSWFFSELVSEVISEGIWKKLKPKDNNEAWDLLAYASAAAEYLGYGKVKDWSRPPLWARPITEGKKAERKVKSRTLDSRGSIG